MAEISKIRRCYNCGVILQCDDENKEGYVNREVLENASQNFLFCNHCFELERYKKMVNEPPLNDELISIIKDGIAKDGLFVYVVNLFSFEASFNSHLISLLKDARLLVVGNKFDLLPVNSDPNFICEYVAHRFRASGLNDVKSSDVIVTSAFNDELTRQVIRRIYELKNSKNVYIIGSQLSGRSTLISSFLRVINNLSQGNIVTEPYPGTKIDILKIPFNSKTAMYDLPGISLENSFLYNLDKHTLKEIYLLKAVKGKDVSLSSKQCLFIGGLAFIEFVEGKRTNFTFYVHDKIVLKKTRLSNKNTDKRFIDLLNSKALKPAHPNIHSLKDLDVYDLSITETGMRDIGILGLGWITFKGNNQKLRIYVPKGVSIYNTRSKVNKK